MNKKNPVAHAIRILQLEGNHKVAGSVGTKLGGLESHISIRITKDQNQFLKACEPGKFDLIVSDSSIRRMDLKKALEVAGKKMPEVPFILVTKSLDKSDIWKTVRGPPMGSAIKSTLGLLPSTVKSALSSGEPGGRLLLSGKMRAIAPGDPKASEASFPNIVGRNSDATLIFRGDYKISFVNKRAGRLFGYGMEELIGKRFNFLAPKIYRSQQGKKERIVKFSINRNDIQSGVKVIGRRKDKTDFPVDVGFAQVQVNHGTPVLATIREENMDGIKTTKSSGKEQSFKRLVDACPLGIVSMDEKERFVGFNLNFSKHPEKSIPGHGLSPAISVNIRSLYLCNDI